MCILMFIIQDILFILLWIIGLNISMFAFNSIQHISIQVNDLSIDIQSNAVHVLIYPGGGLD